MSVKMVDITQKDVVFREAVAEGAIRLRRNTIELIKNKKIEKGDVFTIAKIAGIMAVKNTPQIIPLCHQIPLTNVDLEFEVNEELVKVRCIVKAIAKTGVEMEALTGVTAALLAIWDMVKKYEKDERGQYPYTMIEYIRVISKVKSRV